MILLYLALLGCTEICPLVCRACSMTCKRPERTFSWEWAEAAWGAASATYRGRGRWCEGYHKGYRTKSRLVTRDVYSQQERGTSVHSMPWGRVVVQGWRGGGVVRCGMVRYGAV